MNRYFKAELFSCVVAPFVGVCFGRVDGASATETVDLGSIPGRVKLKTRQNWYEQLPCYNATTINETV